MTKSYLCAKAFCHDILILAFFKCIYSIIMCFFGVATANILSVNQVIMKSLDNYLSTTAFWMTEFSCRLTSLNTWMWQFLSKNISRGSVVTNVWSDEIYNDHFNRNFLMSLRVKELWKLIKIWQSYCREFSVFLFLWHGVYIRRPAVLAPIG